MWTMPYGKNNLYSVLYSSRASQTANLAHLWDSFLSRIGLPSLAKTYNMEALYIQLYLGINWI